MQLGPFGIQPKRIEKPSRCNRSFTIEIFTLTWDTDVPDCRSRTDLPQRGAFLGSLTTGPDLHCFPEQKRFGALATHARSHRKEGRTVAYFYKDVSKEHFCLCWLHYGFTNGRYAAIQTSIGKKQRLSSKEEGSSIHKEGCCRRQ